MIEFPLPWWAAPVVGALIGDSLGFLISRAMGRRVTWKDSSTLWWPVRAWKRRRQAWVPMISVSPLSLRSQCRNYWILTPASVSAVKGLRTNAGNIEIQRWLLRDIKALGAQGAWDRHKPAAPSDNLTIGGLPFAGTNTASPQTGNQVFNRAALQAAIQSVRNAGAQSQARGQAGMQTQHLAQMMQNASQYGTSMPQQAFQPGPYTSQQLRAWSQAYYGSGTTSVPVVRRPTGRRPDPVNDPYLAANDFADELMAHLGLASVADLPVKAYMLWVGIRAAQKDGEPWDDMDARLHEVAGVAYVSPAERRAMELRTVAGALYMAEWATEDPGVRDGYLLCMTEGAPNTAFFLSGQTAVELGATDRLTWLLKAAPSAVTYTAYVDMANDRIVITDGKARRYVDRPAREVGVVADALKNASQSALHQLWKVAKPADPPVPYYESASVGYAISKP